MSDAFCIALRISRAHPALSDGRTCSATLPADRSHGPQLRLALRQQPRSLPGLGPPAKALVDDDAREAHGDPDELHARRGVPEPEERDPDPHDRLGLRFV